MKKITLLIFLIFGFGIALKSQSGIDELEKQLKSAKGNKKYELLYKISVTHQCQR